MASAIGIDIPAAGKPACATRGALGFPLGLEGDPPPGKTSADRVALHQSP
jgi:hypothetical protein